MSVDPSASIINIRPNTLKGNSPHENKTSASPTLDGTTAVGTAHFQKEIDDTSKNLSFVNAQVMAHAVPKLADIMIEIMSNLPSGELLKLGCVAKSWNEFLRLSIEKRQISFFALGFKDKNRAVTYGMNKHLCCMNLQNFQIEDSDLRGIAANCPNLRKLVASGNFQERIVVSTLEKLQKLRDLCLHCSSITDATLIQIVKKLPSLRTLMLAGGSNCTGEELEKTSGQHLKLETLSLYRFGITEKGCNQLLQKFPNVEHLTYPTDGLTDDILASILERLENLKSLWLAYSKGENKATFTRLTQITKNLPTLTSLDLSAHTINIDDEGLLQILEKFTNLQVLNLYKTSVTCVGLGKSALTYPNLRSLDVSRTAVTDEGLAQIMKKFPNLEKLQFENTKVTSTGWQKGCQGT